MMPNKNIKLAIISIGVIIIVALGIFAIGSRKNNMQGAAITETKLSPDELKNEIYPKFICPCCGQPLDKNNICCGAAKERIDYIDTLADAGLSEKEIIIGAVKKYGITSLASSSLQEEIKEEISKSAKEDSPKIVIEPGYYNFGDVSQAKGVTTTTFTIKNEGKSELVIDSMESSCMCTTASVINNGEEGPIFGMSMHGNNPKDWQTVIKPGESAELKIYYDPNVHGELRGLITRTIDIYSNDPINFQKQVKIELNQVA